MKWRNGEIQNEFREKFKKSDALNSLKEIADQLTKEEFKDFSDVAMKSAYDKNRVKAVEYMLAFHEQDNPSLLIRIHLQRMLAEDKDLKSGEKMLRVLGKHFSTELCDEVMISFVNSRGGKTKQDCEMRKIEIEKILLEVKLPMNNNNTSKKMKI
jgi:hypothetical protein